MINADYEYIDYASSRLHSSSYDFLTENQAISNKYTSAGNIRVGTEWRVLNPMSIRAALLITARHIKKESATMAPGSATQQGSGSARKISLLTLPLCIR